MARTEFRSVDDYIAAQPPRTRRVLARVRTIVRKALPQGVEGISYQIPTIQVDGAMVLYFAGYPHHWAIYPASARVLAELGRELEKRLHGKATLRFSLDEPVPAHLISRVAKLRAAEVAEHQAARAAARAAKKTPMKKAAAAKKTPMKKARAKKTPKKTPTRRA